MSRIPTPADIENAPEAAQPMLEGVKAKLGIVPNLYRLTANSPAALEGLLGLSGALGKGKLGAATGERIALAVANVNGCDYCNAAHGYIAANIANLSNEEVEANRHGRSLDPKADAAVAFARKLAVGRGSVTAADVEAVSAAGYSTGELVEIVAHVAANVFTNYLNEAFATEIDFPSAPAAERIAA
jgi:uncharacterized peroxidase-related enzyme